MKKIESQFLQRNLLMKYALLDNNHGTAGITNTGDHVQSLAAKQYLPRVDFFVERDRLDKDGYEKAKVILNGWFTFAPENWPPNENLDPLFISFHLNPVHAPKLLANPQTVAYLKEHGPIGCRDYGTKEILENHGVPAYYSSCLTTTLDLKYGSEEKTDNIYMVDVLYGYDMRFLYKADPRRLVLHLLNGKIFKHLNLLKKAKILNALVPKNIQKQAIKSCVYAPKKLTSEKLYEIAATKLADYAKAKLVITSRIHAALPCIAMNTPVLFILDGLENPDMDISRFNGTVDHLNILSNQPAEKVSELFGKEMNVIHPEAIDWDAPPANPTSHLQYAQAMKQKCTSFIAGK